MTDWVSAINSGGLPPIDEVASQRFNPEALCALAAVEQGRDPAEPNLFGSDDFREPLSILCRALEEEAHLTVLGRWITHRFLGRLLAVRIQINDWLIADPALVDEQIESPIIILGAPRTGTTRVHALLAQDPFLRAPLGWEFLYPVPPPTPGADQSARRRLAQFELGLPQLVSTSLSSIHHYDADMFKECLSAMSFSFRSEEFTSRYRVPGYADWLHQCDMTPAYEMHRTVLRVLQRRQPTKRWVLKSPVHLHSIPVLLNAYPDARLIVTHRDPTSVIGSVNDLIATLRSAMSDYVDRDEIDRYHVGLYSRSLNGLAGDLEGVDHVTHCGFADLITDEVEMASSLCAALGLELSDAAGDAMKRYVAEHPPNEHGAHHYEASSRPDDFAPYLARNGDLVVS
jgi:hypothetical protein